MDTAGTKGSVSINANGTVHYDPNGQFQSLTAGQTATDTFTYTVSDGYHTATGDGHGHDHRRQRPAGDLERRVGRAAVRRGDPGGPVTSSLTVSSPDTHDARAARR